MTFCCSLHNHRVLLVHCWKFLALNHLAQLDSHPCCVSPILCNHLVRWDHTELMLSLCNRFSSSHDVNFV